MNKKQLAFTVWLLTSAFFINEVYNPEVHESIGLVALVVCAACTIPAAVAAGIMAIFQSLK